MSALDKVRAQRQERDQKRIDELEAVLRDILTDRTEPLYAWAQERGIGNDEWQRRAGVVDRARDAIPHD